MNLGTHYWCTTNKASQIWDRILKAGLVDYKAENALGMSNFSELVIPETKFSVMYGGKVGVHTDPDHYLQPMLILQNDDRWCFKSPRQSVRKVGRPKPGYMTILRTDRKHQVAGRSGELWIALGWSSLVNHEYKFSLSSLCQTEDLATARRQFNQDLYWFLHRLGLKRSG